MLKNRTERNAIRTVRYEWNHYKTVLIILAIAITLELYVTGYLSFLLESLGSYGYLGGFVSGFLYTFGVSTPFAIASFFVLAKTLDIWYLAILGSLGGLISEYIIYEIAKYEARKTIKMCKENRIELPKINSGFLKRASPLIAGIIIASPIPDEFVAVLFGMEKYKLRDFLLLTFIFKFIGILLIVGLGRIF